ncbi:MAG: hypothetical protein RL189_543 [Pseudomonadota bacterium]
MARSKTLYAKVCENVCAELNPHLQHAAGIEKGLSGIQLPTRGLPAVALRNRHQGT